MHYTTALIQLPLVRETPRRLISSPADTYEICRDLAALAQESFHVLALDVRNRLLNRHLISLGLADASLVHPREVFRAAVSTGASAVIISHNHPSGDPTPSAEDLRITRQLIAAGQVLDIRVLDHVIIGRPSGPGSPGFLSMREAGLCTFT